MLLLRESLVAESAANASSGDNEFSVLIAEGKQGGLVGGLGQLTQLGHRADEPWMGPCPCCFLSDKHRDRGYYTHMAGLAQREPGQGTQRKQPGREEAEESPNGLSPGVQSYHI